MTLIRPSIPQHFQGIFRDKPTPDKDNENLQKQPPEELLAEGLRRQAQFTREKESGGQKASIQDIQYLHNPLRILNEREKGNKDKEGES